MCDSIGTGAVAHFAASPMKHSERSLLSTLGKDAIIERQSESDMVERFLR
jgi:hypothetical protein